MEKKKTIPEAIISVFKAPLFYFLLNVLLPIIYGISINSEYRRVLVLYESPFLNNQNMFFNPFEEIPLICKCRYPGCDFSIKLFVRESVDSNERMDLQEHRCKWLTSIHDAEFNNYLSSTEEKDSEYLHPKPNTHR